MKPMPERMESATAERVRNTAQQRADVNEAVMAGRPLDAEKDTSRKLAYIERKVGVTRAIATRIAEYDDPENMPLTAAQKSEAESLQGRTVDFVPISFLDIARAASRPVARVAFRNRNPVGSGFMVSPSLFLTNNHVIATEAEAASMVLEFNYESDLNLASTPVTRFAFNPTKLFFTDPENDLDYTLIAVGERIDGSGTLSDFGYLPLINADDKHIKAMFVNVVQHPEGRPKELVVRENRVVARTKSTLIYGADTLPGSSGSPVLNDSCEVIALHHWGSPHRARLDPEGNEVPDNGNEGIRISAIMNELRVAADQLPSTKAALVREAINPPFRHPSLSAGGERSNEPVSNPEPQNPSSARVSEDGTATWTIPLVVSVRLGEQAAAKVAAAPPPPEERTAAVDGAEAFPKPDSEYSNRRGYNPNFIGANVPLPKLSGAQKKVAAKNLKAKPGADPYEVKYQHFSVVMNGQRRLPFFTAVNVDGSSVVHIDRKTGRVTSAESTESESAEAYEKWYDDPRIDAGKRSDQSLYSDPTLRDFQRGHLVKRTDPSWGGADRAIRGQADTFHFTNCAPQHKGFNPVKSRWAGVEDWITNGSDNEDMRVTVFSGPVFRSDDPKFGYIRVPREFWKVVVRIDAGQLLATAILADQGDLLEEGESANTAEDLPSFPTTLPKEYQVTIAHIEELTGLDFGSLRDQDTFGGGEGESAKRRVETFSDISIERSESA